MIIIFLAPKKVNIFLTFSSYFLLLCSHFSNYFYHVTLHRVSTLCKNILFHDSIAIFFLKIHISFLWNIAKHFGIFMHIVMFYTLVIHFEILHARPTCRSIGDGSVEISIPLPYFQRSPRFACICE